MVDMVASRVALQRTHCKISTSLFSQPYCAQCKGDNARGLANHVNGWNQLRNKRFWKGKRDVSEIAPNTVKALFCHRVCFS